MNATNAENLLDVRPLFACGEAPCTAIDQAVAKLLPDQSLVLLAPFEPKPLYVKLGHLGFSHRAEPLPDGSWRIEFLKTGEASAGVAEIPACGCTGAH